jgi:hypothetical protein
MRHSYPIGTIGLSVVGNLSRFAPHREPQEVTPKPTYRVRATQPIADLFRLTQDEESLPTGDFTDASLDE